MFLYGFRKSFILNLRCIQWNQRYGQIIQQTEFQNFNQKAEKHAGQNKSKMVKSFPDILDTNIS